MGIKAGDGRGRIATSLRSFVPADQRKPTRDVLEFKGSSCATASERLTSDPLLPARSRAPEKTNTSAIDLYRKSKQSFTIPNLAKTKTRTRKTTNTSNVFICFCFVFSDDGMEGEGSSESGKKYHGFGFSPRSCE